QRLAAAAGYDPHGMVRFFTILRELEGLEIPFLEFLSTHPLTSERIERARVRAELLTPAPRSRPKPVSPYTPRGSAGEPEAPPFFVPCPRTLLCGLRRCSFRRGRSNTQSVPFRQRGRIAMRRQNLVWPSIFLGTLLALGLFLGGIPVKQRSVERR